MRHYCILLAIFTILFVNVHGWQSIMMSDVGSEHLGDCYTKENNIGAMKKGEERRMPGQCAILICGGDRNIQVSGCGSVSIEPPCRVVHGILSKPYPQCCFEIECPEKNPEESFKTAPTKE